MNALETLDPRNFAIEALEKELLELPQIDCPLTHEFAPGVYFRTITMPAGAFIIGQEHVTAHWNLITRGRARVMMDGEVQEIVAPHRFVSEVGVRKILYIVEEMEWSTIHPTDETDVCKLEEILIVKSPSFKLHEDEMRALTQSETPCLS